VGISGPFALAAGLMRGRSESSREAEVSTTALELASGAIAPIATAFLEAGANVVFIREELPSSMSSFSDLAALLATTTNIIRFYQAIPVLLLSSVPQNLNLTSQQSLDCIVCPAWCEALPGMLEKSIKSGSANLGIAIPASLIAERQPSLEEFAAEFRRLISDFHPALITTSGDVPATADLKDLNKLRNLLIA